MLRVLAATLIVVGVLGFVGGLALPNAGSWLDDVELPPFFETTVIALPSGDRLTATMPTQRVQVYRTNGHFVRGWFVDAKGGRFAIGLTSDGRIAVCTARGREIFLFDLDGRVVGRQPCFRAPREVPTILQPDDFPASELKLQRVVPAERPTASLLATLLVPLWHPFVAVLMGIVGVGGLRYAHSAS
jgi:hypothetical protein